MSASLDSNHVFHEARQLFPEWCEPAFVAGWLLGPMLFAYVTCQSVARVVAVGGFGQKSTAAPHKKRLLAAHQVVTAWRVLLWLMPISFVVVAVSVGGPLSPIGARTSAFVAVVGACFGMFFAMPGVYKITTAQKLSLRECLGECLFQIAIGRLVVAVVLTSFLIPMKWSPLVAFFLIAEIGLFVLIPKLVSLLLRLTCKFHGAPPWVVSSVNTAFGISPSRSVLVCIKSGSVPALVGDRRSVWISNQVVETACKSDLANYLIRERGNAAKASSPLHLLGSSLALLMPLVIPLSAELPAPPRALIFVICFGGALLVILSRGKPTPLQAGLNSHWQSTGRELSDGQGDKPVRTPSLFGRCEWHCAPQSISGPTALIGEANAIDNDALGNDALGGGADNLPIIPCLVVVLPLTILVASLFAATSRAARVDSPSLDLFVALTGGRMPSSIRALAEQKEKAGDAWASGVFEWAANELDK